MRNDGWIKPHWRLLSPFCLVVADVTFCNPDVMAMTSHGAAGLAIPVVTTFSLLLRAETEKFRISYMTDKVQRWWYLSVYQMERWPISPVHWPTHIFVKCMYKRMYALRNTTCYYTTLNAGFKYNRRTIANWVGRRSIPDLCLQLAHRSVRWNSGLSQLQVGEGNGTQIISGLSSASLWPERSDKGLALETSDTACISYGVSITPTITCRIDVLALLVLVGSFRGKKKKIIWSQNP